MKLRKGWYKTLRCLLTGHRRFRKCFKIHWWHLYIFVTNYFLYLGAFCTLLGAAWRKITRHNAGHTSCTHTCTPWIFVQGPLSSWICRFCTCNTTKRQYSTVVLDRAPYWRYVGKFGATMLSSPPTVLIKSMFRLPLYIHTVIFTVHKFPSQLFSLALHLHICQL